MYLERLSITEATHHASRYFFIASAALVAGGMNAVAGGGSFFSFPALMGLGLPPVNANATNTVALWPGQIASIVAFRSEYRAVRRLLLPSIVSTCIGGVAGALLLLFTNQGVFLNLVPWLLLFATVLFAAGSPIQQWIRRTHPAAVAAEKQNISPAAYVWLTIVSIYVGYFGAGAGFLFITLFTLYGLTSLNQVNALKVVCTSVANGVAVITFIVAGAVYWKECLIMILFSIAGSYVGASYSRRLNPVLLRWVIIATGLILSAYYFWK
ncbi:MAG: hypothetical protein JWO80_740 [Bryobacterales bacterium]|nr:hypothetical protein [Bryobacterales bacterium]